MTSRSFADLPSPWTWRDQFKEQLQEMSELKRQLAESNKVGERKNLW